MENAGTRALLVAYGILNAVLYASLLPLWEGFDEPFHYGYVVTLSRDRRLPELGKTSVPPEVWNSLQVAPASHVVKQNLPFVTTFAEYFRLPLAGRAGIRRQLEQPSERSPGAPGLNYEAHQPPLAYAILALVELPFRSFGLLTRVWLLRIFCGIVAVAGTAVFTIRLASHLGLTEPYAASAVFVILSTQMFYATTAHVANDWLAVPLMVLLFERLAALVAKATAGNAILAAIVLALGLLTKAYFLAMVPLFLGVLIWLMGKRRLRRTVAALCAAVLVSACGPWYLRNLRLQGNLSGMQETTGGIDWRALSSAFVHVPWLRSAKQLIFASLWTGNNSFTTFSAFSLSMLLAGFAAAAIFYAADAVRRRGVSAAGTVILCGCSTYAAGLVYVTALSFWYTKGAAIVASPWYVQPVAPLAVMLLFCGLARFRPAGVWVGLWIICWSAYLIVATYWAKLIPMYAGYPEAGKTKLLPLVRWYGNFSTLASTISLIAMTDASLIFVLAILATSSALVLLALLSRRLYKSLH